MLTLSRETSLDLWDKYWYETKQEWFKVEVLQDYSAEDKSPSLSAWLQGNHEKSLRLLKESLKDHEWVKMCRLSPARKIRIHVIQKPYTPYLEWELEHYKIINAAAGEEISLVNNKDILDLNLPDGDFMIFDQVRVVRNHYNSKGWMTSADFYGTSDDISNFLNLRKSLLKLAKPYSK